ncbi:hypothetical protein OSB04_013481 [Centaurea solstitialis]|uniref:Uncharacterized protein n=1 Tax=Centaurea solstitialis TaxID=347529 RepID=A0AA38TWE4_9ASTR|nr:hypothetical protein OSB04_013481 [Centaurea solstitialis]
MVCSSVWHSRQASQPAKPLPAYRQPAQPTSPAALSPPNLSCRYAQPKSSTAEGDSNEKHITLRKCKEQSQSLILVNKGDFDQSPPLIISTLPLIASILRDHVHHNREMSGWDGSSVLTSTKREKERERDGRAPCCDKANVKKGPWSPEEDAKLKDFIDKHGTGGNWIALPHKAGLKRCGKSCRLRWLNYLRPNIKHGEFSEDEDRIICSLYANIGSRWSIIAGQLPGRTDNDIKNYWNTKLRKKLLAMLPSFQKKPSLFPSIPLTSSSPPPFSSSFYNSYNPQPNPNFIINTINNNYYYPEVKEKMLMFGGTTDHQVNTACSSSEGGGSQIKDHDDYGMMMIKQEEQFKGFGDDDEIHSLIRNELVHNEVEEEVKQLNNNNVNINSSYWLQMNDDENKTTHNNNIISDGCYNLMIDGVTTTHE